MVLVPADPDFTVGMDLQGSITTPDHDITLTADGTNRHYGIPGAGVRYDCSTCATDAEDELNIDDDNVTLEWLEVSGDTRTGSAAGVEVGDSAVNVLLQYLLAHDNENGLRLSGTRPNAEKRWNQPPCAGILNT